MKRSRIIALVPLLLIALAFTAASSDAAKKKRRRSKTTSSVTATPASEEEMNVRVVQERFYKKSSRLSLGIFAGVTHTDPFLDVSHFGGTLGFFFTERIGIRAHYWRFLADRSTALDEFDRQRGGEQSVVTNPQKSFMGGEIAYSPLYGKMSLMGDKIIYFDFLVHAGAGIIDTKFDRYLMPIIGFSQYIYLNDTFALDFAYRFGTYKDEYQGKSRTRYDGMINFGTTITF